MKSEVQGSLPCTSTQWQVQKCFWHVQRVEWALLSLSVKFPGMACRTGCVTLILIVKVQGRLPCTLMFFGNSSRHRACTNKSFWQCSFQAWKDLPAYSECPQHYQDVPSQSGLPYTWVFFENISHHRACTDKAFWLRPFQA